MRNRSHARLLVSVLLIGALVSMAAPQFRAAVRVVGVGAAVSRFGPEINRAFNRLTNHQDNARVMTKVVPIITTGINSRQAIGAVQVMGPPASVRKVQAVVAIDQEMFGNDLRIRALIPVDSMNPVSIRRIDGVGISGTVDLRL